MVNMSQKTTEQKRHRRTRLKRAMEPLLKRFACTQMEVAGCVDRMLRENEQMAAKIKDLEQVVEILRETEKMLNGQNKELIEKIKLYNEKGLGDALI